MWSWLSWLFLWSQVPHSLFSTFQDSSKVFNYNWYHSHLNVQHFLFSFFYTHYVCFSFLNNVWHVFQQFFNLPYFSINIITIIITIIIIVILLCWEFFTSPLYFFSIIIIYSLRVFHIRVNWGSFAELWVTDGFSLEFEWQQVSRTLLSIPADPSYAKV